MQMGYYSFAFICNKVILHAKSTVAKAVLPLIMNKKQTS